MASNSQEWSLFLLVNPSSKVNLILMVDALLLLIIGIVIILLYFKEKIEDEKE